jgi:hypothetical protein
MRRFLIATAVVAAAWALAVPLASQSDRAFSQTGGTLPEPTPESVEDILLRLEAKIDANHDASMVRHGETRSRIDRAIADIDLLKMDERREHLRTRALLRTLLDGVPGYGKSLSRWNTMMAEIEATIVAGEMQP